MCWSVGLPGSGGVFRSVRPDVADAPLHGIPRTTRRKIACPSRPQGVASTAASPGAAVRARVPEGPRGSSRGRWMDIERTLGPRTGAASLRSHRALRATERPGAGSRVPNDPGATEALRGWGVSRSRGHAGVKGSGHPAGAWKPPSSRGNSGGETPIWLQESLPWRWHPPGAGQGVPMPPISSARRPDFFVNSVS